MPSEAEKIRLIIREYGDEFSQDMPRVRRKTAGGAANIHELLRSDHRGRYPFELLQNAHDACASMDDRSGKVWFVWSDHALHVADNGTGFNGESVDALVGFGNTTKSGDASTIGYKGIGFISVYELTDRPQIATHHGINFGFDCGLARERKIPPSWLPLEIPGSDFGQDESLVQGLLGQGATTVIRLPFRLGESASQHYEDFRSLMQPETLLFMPKVGKLEVRFGESVETWACKPTRRVVGLGKVFEIKDGRERREYLYARRTAEAGLEVRATPGWEELEEIEAGVAIPWSDNLPTLNSSVQKLCAYYPTEDSAGWGLLVHGDFLTSSNRKRIEAESPITSSVRALALELATDFLRSIASEGRRTAAGVLDVLGQVTEPTTEFGESFRDSLMARLKDIELVPVRGQESLKPASSCSLVGYDENMNSPDLACALLDLLDDPSDIADPEVLTPRAATALRNLQASPISDFEIAQRITPSGTDFDGVVTVLRNWVQQLPGEGVQVLPYLSDRPVILDRSGCWRPPKDAVIDGDIVGNQAEVLDLHIAEHLETEESRAFVEDSLKVSKLDLLFVVDRIGKRAKNLQGLGDPGVTRQHERFLDILKTFWETNPEECTEVLNKVRNRTRKSDGNPASAPIPDLVLPARSNQGDRTGWRRLGDGVYFTEDWSGDSLVERLYGHLEDAWFLAHGAPREPGVRDTERQLFEILGVRTKPVLRDFPFPYGMHGMHGMPGWSDFYETISSVVKGNCPGGRGHPRSTLVSELHGIDRIADLVTDPTVVSSQALLEVLEGKFSRTAPDRVRCDNQSHNRQSWPFTSHAGYQEWLLSSQEWVPFEGRFLSPAQFWASLPKKSTLKLPRTPPALESTKGIRLSNYKKPKPEDLAAGLELLADLHPEPDQDVAKTADWLTRKLCEPGIGPIDPDEIVLLGHQANDRVWVGPNEECIVWDIPGLEEIADRIEEPVIWDQTTDLSPLGDNWYRPLASELFEVRPRLRRLESHDPWLSEERLTGIVATATDEIRRPVAAFLESMRWKFGEGLSLTFMRDGTTVGETNAVCAFFSAGRPAPSPPTRKGAGPTPQPEVGTMYLDNRCDQDHLREEFVDQLLACLPREWHTHFRTGLVLILNSSTTRWKNTLGIGEEELIEAEELLDEVRAELAGTATSEVIEEDRTVRSKGAPEPDQTPPSPPPEAEKTDRATTTPTGTSQGATSRTGPSVEPPLEEDPTAPRRDQVDPEVPDCDTTEGTSEEDSSGRAAVRFPAEGAVAVRTSTADITEPDTTVTSSRASSPSRRSPPSQAPSGPELSDRRKMQLEEASLATAEIVLKQHLSATDVRDVHTAKLGWDLQCVIAGVEHYVEVKSTEGAARTFEITSNEVRQLEDRQFRYLVIFVSNMTGDAHTVRVIRGLHDAVDRFDTKDYRVGPQVWKRFHDEENDEFTVPTSSNAD